MDFLAAVDFLLPGPVAPVEDHQMAGPFARPVEVLSGLLQSLGQGAFEALPTGEAAADDPPPPAIGRSPARDLWAMRLARVYQAFPLTCPIGSAC